MRIYTRNTNVANVAMAWHHIASTLLESSPFRLDGRLERPAPNIRLDISFLFSRKGDAISHFICDQSECSHAEWNWYSSPQYHKRRRCIKNVKGRLVLCNDKFHQSSKHNPPKLSCGYRHSKLFLTTHTRRLNSPNICMVV